MTTETVRTHVVISKERTGQDRYRYARMGKALAMTDSLIAAVAREQHAVLVTGNAKDAPIDDIVLFPLSG